MLLRRDWLVALVALSLLRLTPGSALAQTVIVACVDNGSGAIRIVSSTSSCTKKERSLSWNQTGPQGPQGNQGLAGSDGSPDTADQVREKFFAGSVCPGSNSTDLMVKVGPICVDVYEASVWSSPSGDSQYVSVYPCSANGSNCTNIFARSVQGVAPSTKITWFQAQQACKNSGKRLLTNAEWQMAAAGTPDTGTDNGTTDCRTLTFPGPGPTGSRSSCVSNDGVYDMAGNVWEWVGEWLPRTTTCAEWYGFSDDSMCLAGADTADIGAMFRGGTYRDGEKAGIFAITADSAPYRAFDYLGFRCAR